MIAFVIPKIVTMFEDLGQALPIPTAILVSISSFTVSYWYLIIGLIILVFFIALRIVKTKEGKLALDHLKLRLPVIGDLTRKSEIARFARTLGTLLQNGVPILESLEVVAATMQNAALKNDVLAVYREVRDGKGLAKSLSSKRLFQPFLILTMGLVVGFIVISMLLPIFQINIIAR